MYDAHGQVNFLQKSVFGLWCLLLWEVTGASSLKALGLFSLKKGKLGGILSACCLMRESKNNGARLFWVVASPRIRATGHQLKYWKFCLNMRKSFFIVKVTKHWRFPRWAVGSTSPETFKTGHGHRQPAVAHSVLCRDLDWTASRGYFQTTAVLWFCDLRI